MLNSAALAFLTKRKITDSFRDAFWFSGITELEEKTEAAPLISQTSVRCLCAYLPTGFVGICTWMPMNNHTRGMIDRPWIRHDDGFRRRSDSSPIWHDGVSVHDGTSILSWRALWRVGTHHFPCFFQFFTVTSYVSFQFQ